MNRSSSFTHNTLLFIGGRAINLALAPLAMILLPGLLGERGYGQFGYWFSLISLYLILLDLGTQPVIRRFVPELHKHPAQASTLVWFSLKLRILPLLLVAAALLFTADPKTQWVLLGSALLASLSTTFADLYYSREYMGRHVYITSARKLLRLLFVPLFFVLWEIPGILLALLMAELLAFLLGLPALRLLPKPHAPLTQPYWYYHRIGLSVFLAYLLYTFIGRAPVLASGWSGMALEEIGRIALVVDLCYFVLRELVNSISESILPRLIQLKTQQRNEEFRRLLKLNYRWVNIVSLYVLALGLPLTPTFLLLLGKNYHWAEPQMRYLLLSLPLGAWLIIHNQILIIHGRGNAILLAQVAGLAMLIGGLGITRAYWSHEVFVFILLAATTASSCSAYLLTKTSEVSMQLVVESIRILPAALVTGSLLSLWSPRGVGPAVLAILSGTLIYVLTLVLCKALNRHDFTAVADAQQSQHD